MPFTSKDGLALAHDWANSSLSTTQFCRQRGISRYVLLYWRKRAGLPGRPRGSGSSSTPITFVEVAPPRRETPAPVIRVRLGRVTIIAPADQNAQRLARLIVSLQSC